MDGNLPDVAGFDHAHLGVQTHRALRALVDTEDEHVVVLAPIFGRCAEDADARDLEVGALALLATGKPGRERDRDRRIRVLPGASRMGHRGCDRIAESALFWRMRVLRSRTRGEVFGHVPSKSAGFGGSG